MPFRSFRVLRNAGPKESFERVHANGARLVSAGGFGTILVISPTSSGRDPCTLIHTPAPRAEASFLSAESLTSRKVGSMTIS